MSIKTNPFSRYYDQWALGSPMEVRHSSFKDGNLYRLNTYTIYPKKMILPIIKRNGFKGTLYGLRAHLMLSAILRNSHCETLLKSKQINLETLCLLF